MNRKSVSDFIQAVSFKSMNIRYFFVVLMSLMILSCAHRRKDTYIAIPSVQQTREISSESPSEDIEVQEDTTSTEEDVDDDKNSDLRIARILKKVPSQLLKRIGYIASYNKTTLAPNWVAWHLTADHTDGDISRKGYEFHEDTEVPLPRAMFSDWNYRKTGYQRGHMCPAGDNKWNAEAMDQTFLLTNVCQQNGDLNENDWEYLEELCRSWANKYGDIYIVCGPVYYSSKYKRLGSDRVAVPDAFFKVVLRMKPSPETIGFLYANNGRSHDLSFYSRTTDQIEKITGIDFFNSLDDKIEDRIESKKSISSW